MNRFDALFDSAPAGNKFDSLFGRPSDVSGKIVLGYNVIGQSKDPIHYGTHKKSGVYDITDTEARRKKKTLEAIAAELNDKGFVAAVRRVGQRGIKSNHIHFADPALNPEEADRIGKQTASRRRQSSIGKYTPPTLKERAIQGIKDAPEYLSRSAAEVAKVGLGIASPLTRAASLHPGVAGIGKQVARAHQAAAPYMPPGFGEVSRDVIPGMFNPYTGKEAIGEAAAFVPEMLRTVIHPFVGPNTMADKEGYSLPAGGIWKLLRGQVPAPQDVGEMAAAAAIGIPMAKGVRGIAREGAKLGVPERIAQKGMETAKSRAETIAAKRAEAANRKALPAPQKQLPAPPKLLALPERGTTTKPVTLDKQITGVKQQLNDLDRLLSRHYAPGDARLPDIVDQANRLTQQLQSLESAKKSAIGKGKAQQAIPMGESGKASTKAVLTLAGVAAGALSAAPIIAKWASEKRDIKPEEEKVARTIGKGGVKSKFEDFLNLDSILIASIAKGGAKGQPGRIPEFISERTTFSDEKWYGLVADIALDPLTYVSPGKTIANPKVAKALSAIPGVEKAKSIAKSAINAQATRELLSGARDLGLTRVDKAYEKLTDEYIRTRGVVVAAAQGRAKKVQRLGPEFDTDVAKLMDAGWKAAVEGDRHKMHVIKGAVLRDIRNAKGTEYAEDVKKAYDDLIAAENAMGQALVKAGHLDAEIAGAFKDTHLRRVYERFANVDKYLTELGKKNPEKAMKLRSAWDSWRTFNAIRGGKLDYGAVMKRKNLPEEIRQILQEVPYASVRHLVGQAKAAELIERSKLYSKVATEIALDEEAVVKKGLLSKWIKIPNADEVIHLQDGEITTGKLFGDLAGKYVPGYVAKDLADLLPRKARIEFVDKIDKAILKSVSLWKTAKVPWSVATSSRNFLTNIVFADAFGELSPYRVDVYKDALQSIIKKDKWYAEAQKVGVFLHDTMMHHEVGRALEDLSHSPYGAWQKLKRMADKPGEAYQFSEEWFKMGVYINARKYGMEAEKAAELADNALFNYRKVPRVLNGARRHGILPFVTFTYKALPKLVETTLKNPARLSKYSKGQKALEERTPESVRAEEVSQLPPWQQEWTRLPGAEPRYGNTVNLNPFANIEPSEMTAGRIAQQAFPLPAAVGAQAYNVNPFTGGRLANPGSPGFATERWLRPQAEFWSPGSLPPFGSSYKAVAKPGMSLGERLSALVGFNVQTPDFKQEKGRRAGMMKAAVKDAISAIMKEDNAARKAKRPRNKELEKKILQRMDKRLRSIEKTGK